MRKTKTSFPPCRHCAEKPGRCGRGLCSHCYYYLDVKEDYAPKQRNYYKGAELDPAGYDYVSTSCPPGSEDKIEVMRERMAYGLPVCHPEDAGYRERILPPGGNHVRAMRRSEYVAMRDKRRA